MNHVAKNLGKYFTALAVVISASSASASQTVKHSGSVGFLGSGYDIARSAFKNSSCVTGDLLYGGIPQSSVEMDFGLDFNRVLSELGLSMGGQLSLEIITASGATSFASNIATTEESISFIYKVGVSGKKAFLSNVRLTETGRRAAQSKNAKHIEEVCGDSFIDGIELGGKLLVSFTFQFSNKEIKSKFQADIGADFAGILKVEGAAKVALENYKDKLSIIVRATQVGGDVSMLPQIMKVAKSSVVADYEKSKTATLECRIDNRPACMQAISDVVDYVIRQDGFSAQLSNLSYAPEKSDGPAFLSYNVTKYSDSDFRETLRVVEDLLDREVQVKRQELLESYVELLKDSYKVHRLITHTRLTSAERSRLEGIQSKVHSNLVAVSEAVKVCRDTPGLCLKSAAELRLLPYERRDIVKKMSFWDYCNTPHLSGPLEASVQAILDAVQIPKENRKPEFCDFISVIVEDQSVLNLRSRGLLSLEPLQSLSNLVELDISNNAIADLRPLSEMKMLKRLFARDNRIANLSPIGSLNLTHLDVARNHIYNPSAIWGLKNLRYLRLYGNSFVRSNFDYAFSVPNQILTNKKFCQHLRAQATTDRLASSNEIEVASELDLAPVFHDPSAPFMSPLDGWYRCDLAVSAYESEPRSWMMSLPGE